MVVANVLGLSLLQVGGIQLGINLFTAGLFISNLVIFALANMAYDFLLKSGKIFFKEDIFGAVLGAIVLASFAAGFGASFNIGLGVVITFAVTAISEKLGFLAAEKI